MKTAPPSPLPRSRTRAFTLLELLVVLVISILLVGLTVPTLTGLAQSENLNISRQMVGNLLDLARQDAHTFNEPVEVRIYNTALASSPSYTAIGVFGVTTTPNPITYSYTPLERPLVLPHGVICSSTLSTLITGKAGSTVDPAFIFQPSGSSTPPFANIPYVAFRFSPPGMLNLSPASSQWCLALVSATDTASPPKNYVAIVVDPVTGRVTSFQP